MTMRFVSVAMAAVFCCALCACGKNDDGLTKEQHDSGDRLGQIAKASDGDWNRLTSSDRDFVLKMAYGNERSARMLLLGAAGKIGGKSPGRPAGPGGRAGGPPAR